MRIPALAILMIATVLTAAPARAQTYDPAYPVCLQIYQGWNDYYYECAYTSLPQCNASASGRARTLHHQPVLRGAQNCAAGTARPAASPRLLSQSSATARHLTGQRVRRSSGQSIFAAWDQQLFDPIELPDGRKLVTLRDAAQYFTEFPRRRTMADCNGGAVAGCRTWRANDVCADRCDYATSDDQADPQNAQRHPAEYDRWAALV
jgi:hypothetical protein